MCSLNDAALKVSYLHLMRKQPTLAIRIIVRSRGKTLPHDNGGEAVANCASLAGGAGRQPIFMSVDGEKGAHVLAPQLLMNPVTDSLHMLASTSEAGRSGYVLSRTGEWMRLVRD